MTPATVSVPADRVALAGDFAVPSSARAVVLLPHGVGNASAPAPNRMTDRLRVVGWILAQSTAATVRRASSPTSKRCSPGWSSLCFSLSLTRSTQ
ncbi:hypothetical protein OEB94_00485 [Streptomyces sp. ICN988]|uniref:hypothetical protein n=1 Tax=Streptomyces sp. ICN988 TaxID=2983765 RepID=UPI0021E41E71|nr:hypothetical protein [Streptomyces sp. ICN988]MCV2457780.1 hypothetical protein [Streptomyces sp. ICN988]